jgi:hypothetical protein
MDHKERDSKLLRNVYACSSSVTQETAVNAVLDCPLLNYWVALYVEYCVLKQLFCPFSHDNYGLYRCGISRWSTPVNNNSRYVYMCLFLFHKSCEVFADFKRCCRMSGWKQTRSQNCRIFQDWRRAIIISFRLVLRPSHDPTSRDSVPLKWDWPLHPPIALLACPSDRLKTKPLAAVPMLIKTHRIKFPYYATVILKCAQGCVSREYRRADNSRPVSFSQRMRVSLCYELISSAERNKRERKRERESNKQTARGRSTRSTNDSDSITSTSELLLRQNSVTAHAHQS